MNKRRTSRLGWGSRLLIAAALLAFPAFGLAVILTQDDDSTTRGAPETRIESGPSDTYRLGSAGFRFSKSEGEASFECRLDRGSFKPCDASPTFHLANGPHELEVRAVDMGGNTDLTPARWIWWADALLANGNFETPARGWREQGFKVPGWKGHEGVVSVVKGGIAGDSAGRLTPSRRGLMSMYSAPFPINSTVAGASYTARGFVRSDRPGRTVCLRLREWVGEKQIGAAHSCRKTSESWAKFRPVRYEIRRDGSELDMYVYQATLTIPRDRFDVDGLSLSDGRPPSVPPVPEAPGDPVLLAAGDVSPCWSTGDESVSRLLDTLAGAIAIPGDTSYDNGSPGEFAGCYDPSWGRHKDRTKPAVGGHEYGTEDAAGYFDYFASDAGEPGKGWYSYELGAWHIVVLNSTCDKVDCGRGSEQYRWLREDLDRNAGECVGAYFHNPRFSSGSVHGSQPRVRPFWELLHRHGAEWVLSGDDHNYQRFAPQTPTGKLDRKRGIRQFVVGTGGAQHYRVGKPLAHTEVQNSGAFGVLELTLHDGAYEWRFVPQPGKAFKDSGSRDCSS